LIKTNMNAGRYNRNILLLLSTALQLLYPLYLTFWRWNCFFNFGTPCI